MLVYVLFIIFLLFLAVYYDLNSSRVDGKTKMIAFVIFMLILIAGLRYRMGTDSLTYEAMFHQCPDLRNFSIEYYTNQLNNRIAPLCAILFSIVKTFTDDFVYLQLIISAFVNITIFRTLGILGGNRFFFTIVLLYFIHLYFSINCESLRESLAIGCFYLAIPYLVENNYKKYYIYVLIAYGFHYSALFLAILPLVRGIKLGYKVMIVILGFIIATPFLGKFLVGFNSFSFMSGSMNGMLGSYLSKSAEYGISFMSVNGLIADVAIPIACLYYVKKNKPELAVFEFLVIVEIIIKILSQSIYILYRYDNFLRFIYIYYYAAFIFTLYDKKIIKKTILSYLMLLSLQFYVSYKYWTSPLSFQLIGEEPKRYLLIDPYTSIFDKSIVAQREYVYGLLNKE